MMMMVLSTKLLIFTAALWLIKPVTGQSWQSQVETLQIEPVALKACDDDACKEQDFYAVELTPVGDDKLAFISPTEPGERGLFITDSTGTIRPLSLIKDPHALTPLNDKLVFWDAGNPWVTDGTEQGTLLLEDTGVDSLYFVVSGVMFKDRLYFIGSGQCWITDGTPSGTAFFRDAVELFPLGDSLYLLDSLGQYYKSDGTFSGTVPSDVPPAPGADSQAWFAFGNASLFQSNAPGVYITNGTDTIEVATGSRLYKGYSGDIRQWRRFLGQTTDGRVIFATVRNLIATVWASDGTAEGTFPLTTQENLALASSFIEFDDKVYFIGDTNSSTHHSNNSLWSTDGTIAGTTQLVLDVKLIWEIVGGYCGKVFFWGGWPMKLYMTDGTEMVLVSNLTEPSFLTSPQAEIVSGELFFTARTRPENSTSFLDEHDAIFKIVNDECSTSSSLGEPICAALAGGCNTTFSCCDSTHECSGVCVVSPMSPTVSPVSQPPAVTPADLLWKGFPDELFPSEFSSDGSIVSVYRVYWEEYLEGCEGGSAGIVATCPIGAILMSPSIENGALPFYGCQQLDSKRVACTDYAEEDFPQSIYIACYGTTDDEVRINVTTNAGEYVCTDSLGTAVAYLLYGGTASHIIQMDYSCSDGNDVVNCSPPSAASSGIYSGTQCKMSSSCQAQFTCNSYGCTGGKACTTSVPEATLSLYGSVCAQNFTLSSAAGQACDYNVMCQSGICIGGTCRSELLQDGEEGCREAPDCTGGVCGKAEYSQGAATMCCLSNETRLFGIDRYCGDQPLGAPCFDNDLCSNGSCESGTCGGANVVPTLVPPPPPMPSSATEQPPASFPTALVPPPPMPSAATEPPASLPTSATSASPVPAPSSEPTSPIDETVGSLGGDITSRASRPQTPLSAIPCFFTALSFSFIFVAWYSE